MARKGLNTAIAVVVTIVVLLIIAIAIVTMTVGTISDLGSKAGETTSQFKSDLLKCSALVDERICKSTPGCRWELENDIGKCVPSSNGG